MVMNKFNLICFFLFSKVCLAMEEEINSYRVLNPTKLMIAAKNGNIDKFLKTLSEENTLRDLDINEKNAVDYAIENNKDEKIKLALSTIILLSPKK